MGTFSVRQDLRKEQDLVRQRTTVRVCQGNVPFVPILPFLERPLDLARRCESSLCPFEKCVWLPHPGVSFSRPRMKAIPWKCNVQEGQASVSQAVRGQKNPSCRNRRPTDAAGHIPATLTNGRFCASPSESQADLDRELCELWASL